MQLGWRGRVGALVIAVYCIFVFYTPSARAQETPVFKSTADLVLVQAVVFAGAGGPVINLEKEDFRIFENGKERPISVFIGPDAGPMDIALLVDSSDSMTRWPTKDATNAFLESLHPGSCVLFLPFNDQVDAGIWAHPGGRQIRRRITDLELRGRTALYDALLEAFSAMRGREGAADPAPTSEGGPVTFGELERFRMPGIAEGKTTVQGECALQRLPWSEPIAAERVRRAVVVVTDGQDNKSRASFEDVLVAAWGSGLPVFAFAAIERPRSGDRFMVGEPTRLGHVRDLQRLAEFTGGLVFHETMEDRSGQGFWEGFERVGAALRSHYVLGYVPDDSDLASVADHRDIEVQVRRAGVDVMSPTDLVLGRGASQGAALEQSLRGFRMLARNELDEALRAFDTAAALAPDLGLVEYGRGLAYAGLGRSEDSLASFAHAAELAPWLPDLDAHMAEIALECESFDTAWKHVLRAYARGSEVLALINRLQRVAPREIDLAAVLPEVPRIGLQAGGQGTLLGAVAAPPVLAAIGNAILTSSRLTLADGESTADLTFLMDVRKARQHGQRVSLSGWLVLKRRDGKELDELPFKLDDTRSEEALRAIAERALQWIERAVAAR